MLIVGLALVVIPMLLRLPSLPHRLSCLLFALLSASALHAHDFWIEPSAYRVGVGSLLGVGLRVGEGYRGDSVSRNPARIRRFVLCGPAGEQTIPGAEGAEPAGSVRVSTAGLLVIGYHSRPSPIALEAEKFEAYLAEEGLERIVALRSARRESAQPGREVYSRCAKALVVSGKRATGGHDRRLGLPLELVPEANPYVSGHDLPVRILFHGQPLEGALVVALSKEQPEKRLAARSDRDGRVVFDLEAGRTWLVKAVQMVPAPTGTGADWESFWASLTFETAARR